MNKLVIRHRMALLAILWAIILDCLGGMAFAAVEKLPVTTGLYWAIATATTTGYGDIYPHTPLGRLIAVGVMLTVVPLFGATFSLFTSVITAEHVKRGHAPLLRRLDHMIHHHPDIPELPQEEAA